MKILITGGAGFIGQHLARRLTRAGHSVLALDTLAPQVHADPDHDMSRFPGPVVVGDVAESSAWDLPDTPDAVVHLAAETGTGQSMYEQQRYHRANVGGTTLAGEAACRWDVPIVSVSSARSTATDPSNAPGTDDRSTARVVHSDVRRAPGARSTPSGVRVRRDQVLG